jgi:periplasmic divalent cation tolerance protein
MTDKIIVFVTCESEEQAESIAETVIREKLAACVNILPKMWSCYVWKDELTWSEEFQLLIKTTQGRFGQLKERITRMHTYEVPEIVCVAMEDAAQNYLDWIDTSVGG